VFTSRLLHALGIPAFALFTVALHLWSGLLAFALKGWIATVATLCAPVLSWLAWCAYLWRERGSPANGFTVAANQPKKFIRAKVTNRATE